MVSVGDVYYFSSIFLKQEKDIPHFHPVVLDLEIGYDGNPKKVMVVITDYDSRYVQEFRKRFGSDAVATIEKCEYAELTKKSAVCGIPYQADEHSLKEEDKRNRCGEEVLEKICHAIRSYPGKEAKRIKTPTITPLFYVHRINKSKATITQYRTHHRYLKQRASFLLPR